LFKDKSNFASFEFVLTASASAAAAAAFNPLSLKLTA